MRRRTLDGILGRQPRLIALAGAADIGAEVLAEVGHPLRRLAMLGRIDGERAGRLEVQFACADGVGEVVDGVHRVLARRHVDSLGQGTEFVTAHRIEERTGSG